MADEQVPRDAAGHEMQLVMPFVVCQSKGGPYDDESFTVGWHAARIDTALQWGELFGADQFTFTVRSPLLPQLDLIGMRYHYTMTTLPWPDDLADQMGGEDTAAAVRAEWTQIRYQAAPEHTP